MVKTLAYLSVVILKMISITRMRQGLAIGTVKLASDGAANLDDFIETFLCWSEGTIG